MKKNIILIILIILGGKFYAQEIGQDALVVKSIIDSYVRSHYLSKGYKQVKMENKTEYYNGKISEVVLYKENVPALDENLLGRTFNYLTHYIMKDNLLDYIKTEYMNLSVEELKSIIDDKNKIKEFYFTSDYEYYYKIYLGNNGLATQEYRKTKLNELPINIKSIIDANKSRNNETKTNKESSRVLLKSATPTYEVDDEGVVVIEVSIDKNGNVVKANNTYKSTTRNVTLINSSIQAALKHQFSTIEKDTIMTVNLTFKFSIK